MENWMILKMILNWKKLLAIVIIAIIVIIVGGLIYGTVAGYVSRGLSDTLISDIRADNQRLREGLADAQNRVADSEKTVERLEQRNRELGDQLSASERIAGDLGVDNRKLREENSRLGVALDVGAVSAERLGGIHNNLGDSIDRAWDIVDRYGSPIGPE